MGIGNGHGRVGGQVSSDDQLTRIKWQLMGLMVMVGMNILLTVGVLGRLLFIAGW